MQSASHAPAFQNAAFSRFVALSFAFAAESAALFALLVPAFAGRTSVIQSTLLRLPAAYNGVVAYEASKDCSNAFMIDRAPRGFQSAIADSMP